MYKTLIKQYIRNIDQDTVKKYLQENNYCVPEKEFEILYFFIKNRWEEIYDGKESTIQELKHLINPNLFDKLYKLYLETKQKYRI
ncbi:MAG: hypothetical protein E7168_04290 [Firmicutes bacterium]|nr:hypothetical protein [Bacillota bacterium]